ncbi:hypothetical protein [Rhodanobacter soli]|uniref:hypothetical protein n=1 Tax=Rhodanobacter soli TaxID=590609 RepID=UPI0031E2C3F3
MNLRLCGRAFTIQRRGCDPVNFGEWFGRATLAAGCTLYAIGPCVLYAERSKGGASVPRFGLALGRFALAF